MHWQTLTSVIQLTCRRRVASSVRDLLIIRPTKVSPNKNTQKRITNSCISCSTGWARTTGRATRTLRASPAQVTQGPIRIAWATPSMPHSLVWTRNSKGRRTGKTWRTLIDARFSPPSPSSALIQTGTKTRRGAEMQLSRLCSRTRSSRPTSTSSRTWLSITTAKRNSSIRSGFQLTKTPRQSMGPPTTPTRSFNRRSLASAFQAKLEARVVPRHNSWYLHSHQTQSITSLLTKEKIPTLTPQQTSSKISSFRANNSNGLMCSSSQNPAYQARQLAICSKGCSRHQATKTQRRICLNTLNTWQLKKMLASRK